MVLDESLKNQLEKILSAHCGGSVAITGIDAVGGGSINTTCCLHTSAGSYFLKLNSFEKYPGMFDAEAQGLQLLSSTHTFTIPGVVESGNSSGTAFLLMEWITAGRRSSSFFSDFGKQLAAMHSHTSVYFGLNHNNYIGSLKQSNIQQKNGIVFFIHERLQVQVALALRNRKMGSDTASQFEKLYSKLEQLLPREKPALLHGDLWSGNYLTASAGEPCLIDPAVYYGHREADIAMTRLFGGFDAAFYESYHYHFPLQPGWQQRMEIWNLYPLLVHVNLFAGGYLAQVKQIINRLV